MILASQFQTQHLPTTRNTYFLESKPYMNVIPMMEESFDRPLEDYLSTMLPSPSDIYYGDIDEGDFECVQSIINLRDDEIEDMIRDPIPLIGVVDPGCFKTEEAVTPPSSPEVSIPDVATETHSQLEQDVITKQNEEIDTNHKVSAKLPKQRVIQKYKKHKKCQKQPARKQPGKKIGRKRKRSIHLWEFLRELLNSGNSNSIQWISKKEGIFRLMDSGAVARLWGERKNRHNMTYEKMSRALRYYYEKKILERVPNARLIYKFGSKTKDTISETSEESDTSEN